MHCAHFLHYNLQFLVRLCHTRARSEGAKPPSIRTPLKKRQIQRQYDIVRSQQITKNWRPATVVSPFDE
jgi:hypothetical protein